MGAGPALLLVLGVLLAQAPAAAQGTRPLLLDPDLAITQYVHGVWQVEDGLAQTNVNDLLQSRDGYLWLGTQDGLVRFDGVAFTVFDKTSVDAMTSNTIRALHESRDGTLWIGTDGGLMRYRDGRFETFTTADGLPANVIRALHEDREGHLWIGTLGNGLARFDGHTISVPATPGDLAEGTGIILSMADLPDGSVLVGTAGGLLQIRGATVHPLPVRLPNPTIWSFLVDPGGDVWIGTENGLARMKGGQIVPVPAAATLAGQTVTTLVRDPAGSLWIGTRHSGLFRLVRGRLSPAFDTGSGLSHDGVRTLFVDREGSLWIGTDGGGLNQLRAGKFTPLRRTEGLSHNFVQSVLEDRNGVVWVGTESGGLDRIENGQVRTYTTRDGLPSDNVIALHEDRQGRLWVGTRLGFCRLEAGRLAACFDADDGLQGTIIYTLHEDRAGTLWIGTAYGLQQLRGNRVVPFSPGESLSQELVRTIHEQADGTLWFGTDLGGLYRMRAGRIDHFGTPQGLSSDYILTLHEDADGVLWVGTNGGGLCRRRDDAFQCFAEVEGLSIDKIMQILDDGQGHLWLGTPSGITQVRKADLAAFAEGRLTRVRARVYREVDGLPHREMNGGNEPPAWRSRDGRLWFATVRGLAFIDPQRIPLNHIPPPVRIEKITVDDQPVDLVSGTRFPPGTSNITFSYTALSLAAPEQVVFQFRLEGNDAHWSEEVSRREAFYTNLKPGTYRFRVRARNQDGIWNDTGATFSFEIRPFFYQTPWFFVLCTLLVVLAGVSFYRWRVHHLRARQAELTALVADQTRELRQREHALQELNTNLEHEVQRQLDLILAERNRYEHELIHAKEKAEESARLKTAILRNMSHEIRTPITAILGFAHVLSEEVGSAQQEFVTYISENGRRLLNTLNSILDLAKLETDHVLVNLEPVDLGSSIHESVTLLAPIARRKEIGLRAELREAPVLAQLDRNGIERILQNLVGNAIKFTDAGEVVVAAGRRGGRVYVEVRDTGVGISEEFLPHLFEEFKQESMGLARSHEGSGLGLAITRRLVEALGGTIEVTSTKHVGTTFTVTFAAAAPAEAPAGVPATAAPVLVEG